MKLLDRAWEKLTSEEFRPQVALALGWFVRVAGVWFFGFLVQHDWIKDNDAAEGVTIVAGIAVTIWSYLATRKAGKKVTEAKADVVEARAVAADAMAVAADAQFAVAQLAAEKADAIAMMRSARRRLRALGENPDALEEDPAEPPTPSPDGDA